MNRDPVGYEGDRRSLYRYVRSRPTILVDPRGLASCPPTAEEIASGEAEAVGDVDDDGKTDYRFPGIMPGSGYELWCYSKGNMFFVISPKGEYVHRCPFPDRVPGSRPGRNRWGIIDGRYEGCVDDFGTMRRICYVHHADGELKGKLEITVYLCSEKKIEKGKEVLTDCTPVRRQIMDPPKDRRDLPFPESVPVIPTLAHPETR